MDQYQIMPILEISSISKSLGRKKMPQNLILSSTKSPRQPASAISLNQDLLERLIMMNKSFISTTLQNNHVGKIENILLNHLKRKKWSKQNSRMKMVWKMGRFTNMQCSQTNSTKVCITSPESCTITHKMLSVPFTNKLSRMISFRRWTKLNGQNIWQKSFTACGSILSQQHSRCTNLTHLNWSSSLESCYSTYWRSSNQCVK